ncbi:hypothetical protein [Hansschlegelia zhihuaiae]|uniref:GT-D fold-like domain-containing protein n=1 Tax=Hansschlegelia zhihuaiae TaxID=405005 RepID=A0A4Q0M2V4_9HYPH|nr:hypothetical protein [Hansschlegelia zhihuaiae]RXF67217.1 hypothetical protein EK403_21520 [Hansschlegelia zhihuaiae]
MSLTSVKTAEESPYASLKVLGYGPVTEMLRKAADEIHPFSFIRLGHCEPRILGFPDIYGRKDVDRSLRRQFGRKNILNEDLIKIRGDMREAVVNADLIGIGIKEKPENELDEIWLNTPRILMRDGLVRDQTFCHVNIHYHLLHVRFAESILKDREEVCVITCRDVTEGFRNNFGVKNIEWLKIPEHASTAENRTPLGLHWPDAYYATLEAIKKVGPRLYLVGAGFLGKAYCNQIKKIGGVALDMGSVFDVWAGVNSRSGHTKIIDEFKLG